MSQYVARRLLLAIPTLLGVSIIIFALMRIMPGDVAIMVLGGGGFADIKEEDLIALRPRGSTTIHTTSGRTLISAGSWLACSSSGSLTWRMPCEPLESPVSAKSKTSRKP